MTILFAEPRGSGWIIATLAGRDWQPGVVYINKRAAVAAIWVITAA